MAKSFILLRLGRWQAKNLKISENTYQFVKQDGRKVSVGISTGDFDTADNWLERYDIIVTTNEKADSLLRHRAKWMDQHFASGCRRGASSQRCRTGSNS